MIGDCCHYEEGYDEGFADGQKEGTGRLEIAEAIRLVARKWRAYGSAEQAELLEVAAIEVESMPNLDIEIANEQKRQARVVELYHESRKAAA